MSSSSVGRKRTPSFVGLTAASAAATRAARCSSKKAGTRCEILLQQAVAGVGLKFCGEPRDLPGRPDLIFQRARVAVFCDGDFWHGKNLGKRLERLAAGHNAPYWMAKIKANVARDRRQTRALRDKGWEVLRFWESRIKSDPAAVARVIEQTVRKRSTYPGPPTEHRTDTLSFHRRRPVVFWRCAKKSNNIKSANMGKTTEPKGELRDIEVEKLHLDPENPRLPETLQNAKETEILEYMVRDEALGELAESFSDNAFFRHEPLLIVEREARGTFDVVEGNRRLATLLVLLGRPVAKGLSLGIDLSAARKKELATVPCRVLNTRQEVEPYVGYRHIGGMKKWPAEAKARYVIDQIEKLVTRKDPEPFKTLARRVGSKARPMRHSYVALRLLRHARDEGDFDLQALLDERRFGVWLRAYDSPAIRRYVGFEGDTGEPTTYKEVQAAFRKVNLKRLVEVLEDLVPHGADAPIMDDSRDMSVYASVLTNDRAREVMRKRRSLDEARLLVTDETLPTKIERLARATEDLLIDVHKARSNNELNAAAERLWEAAKALRSAATKKVDE